MKKIAVCCIRPFVPPQTRILLLYALVLSHYQFSSSLFTNLPITYKDKFERNLNWALKVCYFKSKFSSCYQLHLISKITPLNYLTKTNRAIKTWMLLNSCWQPFRDLDFPNFNFNYNARTKVYTLRYPGKTKYICNSFLKTAINEWNVLPMKIKQSVSFNNFKCKIKEYYYNEYIKLPRDRLFSSAWDGFLIQH